jgi:predicted phosphodiesterase
MSIYVTGDTHGRLDIGKLYNFCDNNPKLTRDDYVIIVGDFGGVMSEKYLEQDLQAYADMPFTVLFVDGNHENFDMLNSYPVSTWKGGKVHRIKDNIIHLMRGQVFTIEGKTFFTFGGATSVDKYNRKEGVSWWRQEMPSYAELDEGIANLELHGNEVDYIITHSCGERALMYPPLRTASFQYGRYPENQMLAYFEDRIKFKHWYFGHIHIDARLSDKYTVLYQEIIKID